MFQVLLDQQLFDQLSKCFYGQNQIVLQQGHLVAYISKAFGPRNHALSVYEGELLVITFAVSK